ncbi:hypothetical protein [Streptomyces sp. WAC06614]|uniref:hypothetical protein n=1 Tax=Streptomyces sp. WAC06614 TaxID=2487416 RepID=UPI000F770554|nr:hypothetical protein [Streptomyces sp. WAC06614]RSS82460.1 hypothetical protein EF918_07035 [Streptomyces sp. WAC06614]
MGYYGHENRTDDCQNCGQPLSGRQERFCSAACRQASYRRKSQPAKARSMKPCPLCGDHFEVTHALKRFCDYEDEAEDFCRDAQDDLEEAKDIAQWQRENAACAHCGKPARWSGRGRPRRFCSDRCKTAQHRKAKAAQSN